MVLIGQLDKIIYEKDGFFIGVLKSGEKISGEYHESDVKHLKGAAVTLKGEYVEHKKYGKSFAFETLKVNQNELFFFLNRVVKGFPKKTTAELIEKFGEQGLIDILDNDIERLLDFKGIKKKRLEKIQQRWRQFRAMRSLGGFLSPYGITPVLLSLIASAMKEVADPVERIKNNPYILTSIDGIGFKRADELALKMGIAPLSEKRIGAAMDFALDAYCEHQGNSCVEKGILFEQLDQMLGLRETEVLYEQVLLEQVTESSIRPLSHNRYAPQRLYEAEKMLFDDFKRRSKLRFDPLTEDLDLFLSENDLHLGEEQRYAVEAINGGCALLCLVGYAGTGKSTTSKTVLDLLATRYGVSAVITCALSGIASQRIAETTGYESATIQSLLVKYKEREKMPYDVVLIDEASMISSMLFARLFSKIARDAVVILVGDDAQLPPIGAGNVLGDIVTLGLAPTVTLTKIYRQSEEQAIALIANDIRRGLVPEYRKKYRDFSFTDISIDNYYLLRKNSSKTELEELRDINSKSILASIVETAIAHIPHLREHLRQKRIDRYLNSFQVITPMRGTLLGVDNLNRVLQDYFNPNPKKMVKKGEREFRLMDKVVHTKNENMPSFTLAEFKEGGEEYERRIFNGMSGLLFSIDEEDEQFYVVYPNEEVVVRYEYAQAWSHLMLSYALTIHKVQGMEYDTVVMPMTFSHYNMLNTKLLYTALTRAKKHCYVIGEAGAFESACRRMESTKRDTVMQEMGDAICKKVI